LTEIKDEERFRTIDDILAFAIKKEEEAAAAYGTMIATVRIPGLKKLLGKAFRVPRGTGKDPQAQARIRI
jgi:rubrerythrin